MNVKIKDIVLALVPFVMIVCTPAFAIKFVCSKPTKYFNNAITYRVQRSGAYHINYRIDFPKSLDGKDFDKAYIKIGNPKHSWVAVDLNPKPSVMSGDEEKLVAEADTYRNDYPLYVVALYDFGGSSCMAISERFIRP